MQGSKARTPDTLDVDFHTRQYEAPVIQLEQGGEASTLPPHATTRQAMNDLPVRIRLDDC